MPDSGPPLWTRGETYRIGFLLVPDLTMISVVSAIETLRVANSLFEDPPFAIRLLHDGTPEVPTVSGLTLHAADGHIADQTDADAVIVCASYRHDRHAPPETLARLRWLDRHGVRLGSIESGVYHLAAAGLLNGHTVTAHFSNLPLFGARFPEVNFVRRVFTLSDSRMSAAGGTASVDLMLHLIQERIDQATAARVANLLIYPYRRDASAYQDDATTSPHSGLPQPVRDAARLMGARLTPPRSIESIAADLTLSRRHLDRLFRGAFGCTAADYYRQLRLARARKLVKSAPLDLTAVAEACGFGSYSHFLRLYRDTYGMSPAEDRQTPILELPRLGRISPLSDLHPVQARLDPLRML